MWTSRERCAERGRAFRASDGAVSSCWRPPRNCGVPGRYRLRPRREGMRGERCVCSGPHCPGRVGNPLWPSNHRAEATPVCPTPEVVCDARADASQSPRPHHFSSIARAACRPQPVTLILDECHTPEPTSSSSLANWRSTAPTCSWPRRLYLAWIDCTALCRRRGLLCRQPTTRC